MAYGVAEDLQSRFQTTPCIWIHILLLASICNVVESGRSAGCLDASSWLSAGLRSGKRFHSGRTGPNSCSRRLLISESFMVRHTSSIIRAEKQSKMFTFFKGSAASWIDLHYSPLLIGAPQMDTQGRYRQPDLHCHRQIATLSTLRVLQPQILVPPSML